MTDDMGAPHHEVTPELQAKVKAMSAFGITQPQMCAYLGISEDTLQRHYRHELDTAQVDANVKVANRLFRKATEDGDTSSMIFWLKTRAGWKEQKDENKGDTLVEFLIKQLEEAQRKEKNEK